MTSRPVKRPARQVHHPATNGRTFCCRSGGSAAKSDYAGDRHMTMERDDFIHIMRSVANSAVLVCLRVDGGYACVTRLPAVAST